MRRASFINGGCGGQSNDASPFNSKFTVLKFNSPQVQFSKFNNGLIGSDNFPQRGLFSNVSNYSFAHSSALAGDIFSQSSSNFSQPLSVHSGASTSGYSALSENMNPMISNENAFKHNPLCGFDEE